MSLCYFLPWIQCIAQEEQLRLQGCTSRTVYNGPQTVCIPPFQVGEKARGLTIGANEYIKVENTTTGQLYLERGPQLYFFGAYERQVHPSNGTAKAIALGPVDYIVVENEQTGEMRVDKGPRLWFPTAVYDRVVKQATAIPLQRDQYIKLIDTQTGVIRSEKGEQVVWPSQLEEVLGGGVQKAVNVDEFTAVLVRDNDDGTLRLISSPGLYFPTPLQEIESIQKKILLEDHETMILKDPHGSFHFRHGGREDLLDIAPVSREQEERERSLRKGEVLTEGLLLKLPGDEEPEEPIRYDEPDEFSRAFFLPPYWQIVEMKWTIGEKEVEVTKIDRRPQFMNYEFTCRTCDNVEMIVEATFFWKVVDVKAMIHHTSNPSGDICAHARSVIIQVASQVTLEKFMAEFNHIVAAAILNPEDHFYARRGCHIHTVEVRSMRCKDAETEHVLQEIIQETTHRLSRLQKTESENEVKLYKMKGVIEHQKMITELIRIRSEHLRSEASVEGEAVADKLKAFMQGLDDVEDLSTSDKVGLWNTLRKVDTIERLADGDSHMYFTPSDVNLSIETFENPTRAGGGAKKAKKASKKKGKFVPLASLREDTQIPSMGDALLTGEEEDEFDNHDHAERRRLLAEGK